MKTVEELLNEYRGDVHIAASSFFAWKNINQLAVDDKEIFQVSNKFVTTNASKLEVAE